MKKKYLNNLQLEHFLYKKKTRFSKVKSTSSVAKAIPLKFSTSNPKRSLTSMTKLIANACAATAVSSKSMPTSSSKNTTCASVACTSTIQASRTAIRASHILIIKILSTEPLTKSRPSSTRSKTKNSPRIPQNVAPISATNAT